MSETNCKIINSTKAFPEKNNWEINRGIATGVSNRSISIAIVNLMPNKPQTEKQFSEIFKNIPLNLEIENIYTSSHKSKNTSEEYITTNYKTIKDIQGRRFDGMIITGAPIEHLDFEEVDYWEELKEIMEFSKANVNSTLHICWGAQAGLYYHYGVPKHKLSKKVFGVFPHKITNKNIDLFRGFDDEFYVPHSRHTEVRGDEIQRVPDIEILSQSEEAGIYIAASRDGRQFFITGHSEYDAYTLYNEYMRDKGKGLDIEIPKNYFPNDDESKEPIVKWRAHSNLLFSNWINHYVLKK